MTTTIISAGVSSGGFTVGSGDTLIVSGTASHVTVASGGIEIVSGGISISGTISGTEYVNAGSSINEAVVDGGNLWISAGATVSNPSIGDDATLSLVTGSVVSGAIVFTSGEYNDLDIYSPTVAGVPQVPISGFGPTMTIDLIQLGYPGGTYPDILSLSGSSLVVPTVSGNTTLDLVGNYSGYTFSGTNDGTNLGNGYGDQIIVTPCFAGGTSIATSHGEVRVEDLIVGDVVVSLHAGAAPITWIGHRKVNCRRHPKPEQVWPVRVAAGAFGPDLPSRDLWLSPDHAVYENASLIPVRELINGSTIEQVALDEITYYHIELRHHDIVLAEGLPVETYLDTGNRENFAGRQGDIALHPNFAALVWDASACAPLVLTGPALKKARRRISLIAKNRPKDAPARRRA